MNRTSAFESINELVDGKRPLEDTLQTIVAQLCARESIALARIWLRESGEAEESGETNLLLTASRGVSLTKETIWTDKKGRFARIPIGVRKVGFVAQTGDSVLLNGLVIQNSDWIVDKEWAAREKIVAFPLMP